MQHEYFPFDEVMDHLSVIVLPLFYLLTSSSANLHAQQPVRAVYALEGEDVLLPCYFSPNISSENVNISWVLNQTDAFVHLFEHGFDRNDRQDAVYRGRTALFMDNLSSGNASLKLTNVTVSDEADYTCSVRNESWSWDTSVQIRVKVRPRVIGPDHPIISKVGKDIFLPCYISPNVSAENMMVSWVSKDTGAVVHFYKDGCDRNDQQDVAYRGRTLLPRHGLRKGRASLTLTNAKLSDEATYLCKVQGEHWHNEISIQVKVKALPDVLGPTHPIKATVGEDVLLPCYLLPNVSAENMTVRWVVDHAGVVHLCKDGYDRNDQQGASYRGRTALFRGALRTGNASLKLTNVKASDKGDYTCSFEDGHWHKGISLRIEVEEKPANNTHSWKAAFSIMFLFAVALFVGLFYQAKGKKKTYFFQRTNTQRINTGVQNMRSHGANVILDPDTAHPQLIVSTDGKQVSCVDVARGVVGSNKRFTKELCVLAREGFTQGRHYYEVLVRGNHDWTVGLLSEHVNRHDPLNIGASSLYLALQLRDGVCYSTESGDNIVQLREDIRKVGVFLDYDEGTLSFYDVEDDLVVHLFSYTQYFFSGTLFPIFSPGLNSGPLVILPVWRPLWTHKVSSDEVPLSQTDGIAE